MVVDLVASVEELASKDAGNHRLVGVVGASSQRAGCVHLVEQRGHATVAYQVQVVYRVRAGGHTSHNRGRLARRVGPGITGQADLPGDNLVQPDRLSQPHHRNQPGK